MPGIFFKKKIFSVRASNGSAINVETPDVDSNSLITTIPAGYMLEFIIFHETVGDAITIDIGTTAGDDDILSAYTVGASEIRTQSIGTVFSTTTTQSIYVSSAAWQTSW